VQLLLVYVVIIGAVMVFMTSRGRKKQQATQLMMREGLVLGAEARTIGGMVGEVVELTDEYVILETTPGVKLKFVKTAIAGISSSVTDEDLGSDDDDQDEDQDGDQAEDRADESQDASVDADRAAGSAGGRLAPAPFEADEAELSKK
jgi:preprotein translocase subunit YajC